MTKLCHYKDKVKVNINLFLEDFVFLLYNVVPCFGISISRLLFSIGTQRDLYLTPPAIDSLRSRLPQMLKNSNTNKMHVFFCIK